MLKASDSSASRHNRIIQPEDQLESNLTSVGNYSWHNSHSQQSSLRQALLEENNCLNNSYHNFTHQFVVVDAREIDEGIEDNFNNVNILADIEYIVMGDTGENAPDNSEPNENGNDILHYAIQLDLDEVVKGPRINEKIAGIVKLCLQRITPEQSKTIIKWRNKPENVEIRLSKCRQST